MSIIPSSLALAATAMTSLAQKSAAKAAAGRKGSNPGVSAQVPRHSEEEPRPSTSAGLPEDPPMDPFAGISRSGKGTKGLKGRAKVKESLEIP